MLSIGALPNGVDLSPIEGMVTTRPDSLWGKEVQWPSYQAVPIVYLATFMVPSARRRNEVYLLGTRYELVGALVGGKDYGRGYVKEFIVATLDNSRQWQVHRLMQRGTTIYSPSFEKGDDVPACDIANPAELSLYTPPKWKVSNIEWPTLGERPMKFVGQLSLPETNVTKRHFTYGLNAYLFWLSLDGKDYFKVATQQVDLQTADEHYEAEEARLRLDAQEAGEDE